MNNINEILATKKSWKKKNESRQMAANIIKAKREHERNIQEIEGSYIFPAFVLGGCLVTAFILTIIFCR